MIKRSVIVSARAVAVLVLASVLFGGCAGMHRGFEAVSQVGSSTDLTEKAEAAPVAHPGIKTVQPRGAPQVSVSETSAAEPGEFPAVVASAVPSPKEIFDFHPTGSSPESFRQPFIIDLSDGPLRADVQRSAKELREYMAGVKTDAKPAERKRCSETEVATAKPGCVTPTAKTVSDSSRNAAVR